MRSIADVIRDVLADPENEVDHLADSLERTLLEALLAAGHPVTEPDKGIFGAESRVHGTASLRIESAHEEGESYAELELKADANVWLTAVAGETGIFGPTLGHYDVWIEGFTVPLLDDGKTMLRMKVVEP